MVPGVKPFLPRQNILAINDPFGNVVGLLDKFSGSLDAAYEYSPFGELLRASGSHAAANPFRFSTKFLDVETGLEWFGYRYYSASLGRFINRDPLDDPAHDLPAAPLAGGDVKTWSYVGLMLGKPGEARHLTPDTSIKTASMPHSSEGAAAPGKNSTQPNNAIATQKAFSPRSVMAPLFTPYVGPETSGATHSYGYVNNAAYSAIDPFGLQQSTTAPFVARLVTGVCSVSMAQFTH